MKKYLGVSLIAILAASPFAANAADAIATVSDTATNNIATTSYVAGGVNYAVGEFNRVAGNVDSDGKFVLAEAEGDTPAVTTGTIAEGLSTTYGFAKSANVAANAAQSTADAAAADATVAKDAIETLNGGENVTGSVKANIKGNAALATYDADYDYAGGTIGAAIKTAVSASDGALKKADITTGTETMDNGTISVGGAAVAVKGLGSAAYTNADAYDEAGAATAAANAIKTDVIGGGEETTGKIILAGVEGSKTVQEAVNHLQSGVNAAATVDKLNADTDGYDINAKTLKVEGKDVVTVDKVTDAIRDEDASNDVVASELAVRDAINSATSGMMTETQVESIVDSKGVKVYTTWNNDEAVDYASLETMPTGE